MEEYKTIKGKYAEFIVMFITIFDILGFALTSLINSYQILILLRLLLIVFNIYEIYYLILYITLKYKIDDKSISIIYLWGIRNIRLPLSDVLKYNKARGTIRGVKLSGSGTNNFAFGKWAIDNIGVTNMFVTSNRNIFYIKTRDSNYAVSPDDDEKFERYLNDSGILYSNWSVKRDNSQEIYKEKKFIIFLSFISVLVLFITLNPVVLYKIGKLPSHVPITFDKNFNIVKFGTGKQFAIEQAVYGGLNMALLFCMYYASYFHYRYDKKSAYKYLYVSLFITLIFFVLQLRVIFSIF